MEKSTFNKFLDGPLFTFEVGAIGEEIKAIQVHSGIVAHYSVPLKNMMEMNMCEGLAKKARLEDVDVATFQRFCEFVYFRRYTDPVLSPPEEGSRSNQSSEYDPRKEDSHSNQLPGYVTATYSRLSFKKRLGTPQTEINALHFGLPNRDERNLSMQQFLRLKFMCNPDGFCNHSWAGAEREGPAKVLNKAAELEPVFMTHAKLYVFSDRYDIKELQHLVLRKFHEVLQKVTPWSGNVGAIVNVIEYTFNNTMSLKPKPDLLRELLVTYCVAFADEILLLNQFQQVLREDSEFLHHFSQHFLQILMMEKV